MFDLYIKLRMCASFLQFSIPCSVRSPYDIPAV